MEQSNKKNIEPENINFVLTEVLDEEENIEIEKKENIHIHPIIVMSENNNRCNSLIIKSWSILNEMSLKGVEYFSGAAALCGVIFLITSIL